MASNIVTLVTGANRGIGRALVQTYLSRPSVTIIAGVRDPNSETAKTLHDLSLGKGSKLIVVKIDSESDVDAKAAVDTVKSHHGISNLDVVIANAGIGDYWAPAAETSIKELQRYYNVNAIGPLILFQATLPLLKASAHPKFIVLSSFLGSIGAMEKAPLPTTGYGSSKAALNYTTRKIHQEHPDLTAFAVHPGEWIQTDMGNAGARSAGMAEAPDTLEANIEPLVSVFDTATRSETSGRFINFDGSSIPW